MVVLLGTAALPVVFLLSRLAVGEVAVDGASLAATAAFALGGAAVATATGAAAGITAGVLALPAGRWLIGAACVLIAAPPAFWWLGATHVPGIPWNLLSGLAVDVDAVDLGRGERLASRCAGAKTVDLARILHRRGNDIP